MIRQLIEVCVFLVFGMSMSLSKERMDSEWTKGVCLHVILNLLHPYSFSILLYSVLCPRG